MYRHSPLVILILLVCVFVSCTGGGGGRGEGSASCLNPKTTMTTTNPAPLDQTPIHPSPRQHPELQQWGTESDDYPLLDAMRSIRGKTGILSPSSAASSPAPAAAAGGRLGSRYRRSASSSFPSCQATLATKIDNCTQTFERLFVQHMLTTARTSITQLDAQRLCRQHDESLYCLHIELMACHPREDHLERIAEEIGNFRDYMERLCRYVRQTSSSSSLSSSIAPIFSSPPLESYILHKKFNQLKHTAAGAVQKTATDRVQPAATEITPNYFGRVGHSNLSLKMFLNSNVHNEDKDSEFNRKLHHKMSNIKASKENSTEADDVRTSQNAAATMTIVEPQILAKRNNPHTRNSCPSQVPDIRCLCLHFLFGFILTVATSHLH